MCCMHLLYVLEQKGDIRIPLDGICVWQLVKGCVGSAQTQRWYCGQTHVLLVFAFLAFLGRTT
jgi:hypothetical protein